MLLWWVTAAAIARIPSSMLLLADSCMLLLPAASCTHSILLHRAAIFSNLPSLGCSCMLLLLMPGCCCHQDCQQHTAAGSRPHAAASYCHPQSILLHAAAALSSHSNPGCSCML
jgi:hypothetical protein